MEPAPSGFFVACAFRAFPLVATPNQFAILMDCFTLAGYDPHFVLRDERTGAALTDRPYTIVTEDGREVKGRTDALGHTFKVAGAGHISATIHILEDETILNPDWDKYR